MPENTPPLTLAWTQKIHDGWGMKLAVHPFQNELGTTGLDGRILLGTYDGQGVTEKKRFDLKASITALAFSRSGRLLVAGTHRGRIIAWHYPSLEPLSEWKAHRGEITDLQFSPGDKYLLSASKDETAARWEIDLEGSVRSIALHGHIGWVLSLESFRYDDQDVLVTSSHDCTAILWNIQRGEPLRDFNPDEEEIVDAVWCAARQLLLTGVGEGKILAWDLDKIRPIWNIDVCKYPLIALALLIHQKKNLLLATGWDFSIHILDLDSRCEVGITRGFGTNLIHDLKVDADENYAFSVHTDGCLRAWHLK
ncbi:MAG: WD repeat-containing protein [Promethearchaeota archaeon CR_4]|nr:MAG: WD repeat-containing protein [Candidatus Lokiarchaeota archaeon CR_4]